MNVIHLVVKNCPKKDHQRNLDLNEYLLILGC